MFSIIIISFSIPKFLENKESFEKNCQRILTAAADQGIDVHL